MKQILLKTWLIVVCLLCGVGTMWAEEYSFTIQTSDFNTTSYAANNGSHDFTATCTTDANKTMTVACTSYQVMKNSNNMQWQKSNGYIYNTTDLGTIKSVTVTSSAGTFTTYYGTAEHPTSGTTVGNGYFTVKVGNATGTTSSVVVVFEVGSEETEPTPSDPVDATWSVSPSAVDVKVGKTETVTITTNYDGSLSVSSDDEGTATASIEGKVITITGVAAGTTTLSVTGLATSSYNAINKTLDVTVTENARPENEIFYESFDTNDGTGGNDGQWSGNIASNNINQDNEGWVFANGSGADECAKFGTGSKLGFATTPALGQACNAILTFKAAAWNTSNESTTLKLSVIGGGSISPATVTMTKGEWNTFTATLTGLTADSKVKFEGNSSSNSRFFLDEVSIVKTGEATPEEPQKTLSSIEVKNKSNKYVYTEGEYFAPGGLTITATYSDDTTEDIHYSDHESAFTFSPALDEPLTVSNTTITITYGGVSTTQTITVEPLVDITNTQETAYTVAEAIALINAGKGLSTPVYVKGVVSKIVTEYSSSYGNISFNVSADGETTGDQFQFFRNFKGADKLKWTDEDTKPAVGDEVIGFGKLTKYSSTYEFAEGNYIVSLTHPAAKTKPELSFANPTYNATMGKAFAAPELTNPQGVTVSYTSSATGVATVNASTGAISLVSAGTTVITASFDGTNSDTYESNSASYTLVVEAATTPEPGDVTPGTYDIVINNTLWATSENGTYNGTIPETLTGTQNGVTITFNKGTGSNLYINDTETRIYANEKLVVSVPDGYSITSIVNSSESSKSATITTSPEGYNAVTKTWTGNAQSVTFTVSGANGFQTLTVTFVKGGGTPEPLHKDGIIKFVGTTGDGKYYATFSSTRAIKFEEVFINDAETCMASVKAYAVSTVDGQLYRTDQYEVNNDGNYTYIPANTGVLFEYVLEDGYTFDGDVPFEYADAEAEYLSDVTDNMLVACPTTGACPTVEGNNFYYKLAYGDNNSKTKLGFWWGANDGSNNFNVKAGGAVLVVPQSVGSNLRGFRFDDEPGRPTGIESISNDVVAGEIYNLQGQRINRLQQGVNIVNGRKVIR